MWRRADIRILLPEATRTSSDWIGRRRGGFILQHKDSKYLQWKGISAHIGSQIVSLAPFRRAFRRLAGYVSELQARGNSFEVSRFGRRARRALYDGKKRRRALRMREWLRGLVRPLGLHLLLEPGRSIIAAAGVLLTRVIYTKRNRGKTFVVVDAAMNDLMRPALYGAVHPITRISRVAGGKKIPAERVDIVGPVCETGDCFLHDWPLGEVQPGDVLAIWVAGAYGMTQASNYNARTRPSEVLIDGTRSKVIRRRETQGDLLRTDALARGTFL